MRDAETILADADKIGDDADYRDHVALDARSSRLLLEVALDQRAMQQRLLELLERDSAMESELSARVAAKEGIAFVRSEVLDALADAIVDDLFTVGAVEAERLVLETVDKSRCSWSKAAARSRIRDKLKTLE